MTYGDAVNQTLTKLDKAGTAYQVILSGNGSRPYDVLEHGMHHLLLKGNGGNILINLDLIVVLKIVELP